MGLDFGVGDLVGGFLGYKGTQDTNVANRDIASARNQFEATEAEKARMFSATEADKNRYFQTQSIANQMKFEERMSSTAVQRRQADLKKAGINPILAGKFDASSPSGSAASGGIGATAKANAHGYEYKSPILNAVSFLSTAAELRKAIADAGKAENAEKASRIVGEVGSDTDTIYRTFKNWLKRTFNSGKNVHDSGIQLTDSVRHAVKTGKLRTENYDKGTRLTSEGIIDKLYNKATKIFNKYADKVGKPRR